MKVLKLSKATNLILIAGLLFFSPVIFCATSTSALSVSATVLSNCVVVASPQLFGSYDSVEGSDVNGSANIAVTCTLSTPYKIGIDAGMGPGATVSERVMVRTGGTEQLSYGLYSDNNHTIVWGNTIGVDTVSSTGTGLVQNFTVYGQISGGQSVRSGAYTDTVTVTVTY